MKISQKYLSLSGFTVVCAPSYGTFFALTIYKLNYIRLGTEKKMFCFNYASCLVFISLVNN